MQENMSKFNINETVIQMPQTHMQSTSTKILIAFNDNTKVGHMFKNCMTIQQS